MAFKAGLLFLTLLIGSNALPVEEDMSIFFEHTDKESRIVGGSTAGPTPFMVALTQGWLVASFTCGGSVLNARRVLTAAHCITGMSLSNGRVVVGTARWSSGGTSYGLSSRIVHPNYNSNTIKNDIGMLVTSSNIIMTTLVQPVSLSFAWAPAGTPTRVTGWGRIVAGGSLSPTLLVLDKATIDGTRCIADVARRAAELNIRNVPAVDPNVEICTFLAEGFGTCNGDSGSPLMRRDVNQQIGIVSWGLPCARRAPDMFVRVSAFQAWIQQNS